MVSDRENSWFSAVPVEKKLLLSMEQINRILDKEKFKKNQIKINKKIKNNKIKKSR